MNFDAVMLSRTSFEPTTTPPGLTFEPVRWSWDHHYGPYIANVEVHGNLTDLWHVLSWLRNGIEIVNVDGDAVWWGLVNEVQLMTGALSWTASLEGMYNAVTVLYSYTDIDGNATTDETSTTTNTDSINRFGRKEILRTASDIDATQADYFRDQILDESKYPIASPAISSGKARAVLHCRGYAHAYSWLLYGNDAGKIEHATSMDRMQKLGWGYTSSNIGFTNDYRIMDVDGALADLTTDDLIRIDDTVSNDGNREVTESDNRAVESYTSTTISFETDDDIKDSEQRLGFVQSWDMIEVSGASTGAHNDFHLVDGEGASHIKLEAAWNTTISNESAGNSVTIARGNTIKTSVAGGNETPGTSFTITGYGEKMAQSFTNSTGSSWTVDSISVYLAKVGSPSDDVYVRLYSDNTGAPGTLLETATIDGADVGTAPNWIEASFANTQSISNSTLYWIVLERTGSNDYDDYFTVGITESDEYTGGALWLHNSDAYVASTNNDMMFRVWGADATTDQIQTMLNDVNITALETIDIVTASGIDSNQYRSGERTVLDEITDLIDLGTSSGGQLYFEVTRERVARVKGAPSQPTEADYMLRPDGVILDKMGQPLPPGKCMVADWVELIDVPSHIDILTLVTPLYVTRCDYDARRGVTIPTAKGAPNPFDVGRITR